MKPIILEVHKLPCDDLIGTVRITAEAEKALRQLARESGLSMRTVASQIIIQASPFVEIRKVE